MAIKDRNTIRVRRTPSQSKIEPEIRPRFVLTPDESKRILEALARPPATLTDEAKRSLAPYKRVKVTRNF